MSRLDCPDPVPGDAASCDAIEDIIVPRARDLGGFEVRRALPSPRRQMIGPFIFFDQMGPAELARGQGLDVRPHPHIGLATATYLFDGEVLHRDSIGTALAIEPGALNLMTAGRGIVHSERTPPGMRAQGAALHGIQSWLALPKSLEEGEPGFRHYASGELPRLEAEGKRLRLILGDLYGERSPATFPHEAFYAEAVLAPGAVLPLDAGHEERAVYIVSGAIDIAGQEHETQRLLVFRPGDRISILATRQTRLMLMGGEPMDGPRHIWWNFVSSDPERIAAAKEDWRQGRFAAVPGDEEEVTPLPDNR